MFRNRGSCSWHASRHMYITWCTGNAVAGKANRSSYTISIMISFTIKTVPVCLWKHCRCLTWDSVDLYSEAEFLVTRCNQVNSYDFCNCLLLQAVSYNGVCITVAVEQLIKRTNCSTTLMIRSDNYWRKKKWSRPAKLEQLPLTRPTEQHTVKTLMLPAMAKNVHAPVKRKLR